MIELRTTAIFRIEFAADGTKLNNAQWKNRERLLMEDVKIQLPSLHHLQASRIITETEILTGQIFLIISLQELPQMSLPNLSSRRTKDDMYSAEVHQVREQQAALHERLQKGILSFESPADLPELADLRALLWRSRRGGFLQIPSSLAGEILPIPHLAHAFPTTAKLTAEVQVLQISRAEVWVSLKEDLDCPESGRPLFSQGATLNLHRSKVSSTAEETVQLALEMHLGRSIQIALEIEYSWVNGHPHRLTLFKPLPPTR